MKTITTMIVLSLIVAGVAQAEFRSYDLPSESICKAELKKFKIVLENSSDIRYCQSEKDGTEVYCKKTNGKVALAMCSGKTISTNGF